MALETNSNRDVDVTKDLLQNIQDSINGYAEASDIVHDAQLAQFFRQRAASRQTMANRLAELLKIQQPTEFVDRDGTLAGAIHQGFMKLRAAIQDDERAALAEVERGEHFLVERVQHALEKDVSVELRNLLQEFLTTIESESAEVDRLRELA